MRLFRYMSKQTKIIAAATLISIAVTLFLSVNSFKYRTQDKISVRATVSAMEMYDDSTSEDTDWGYDVFVDYHCRGKTYSKVSYGRVPIDTDLKEGSKIDILVYSDEPENIAKDTFNNSWVFAGISALLLFVSIRKIHEEKKGGNRFSETETV